MRSPTLLAAALLALPALAAARPISVYLNDVKVDGLKGQSFTNVDVRFDDNGDIRITAKGYKVTPVEPPKTEPTTPTAAAGVHRFWIATVQPRMGMAQWDVDVYINQTFVKKFRSRDPEPVFEITRFLQPGANVIHYKARKEEGERQSMSPNDYFELVVGDGEKRAGQVMLNKITSYRRTAAETGAFDSEVTVNLAAQ